MALKTSRSVSSILRENIFTLFNIMLAIVAAMVISTGSFADCLFVIVIFINALIGIITELRAKMELDKLAILIESKYHIIRNSESLNISSDLILEGDLITLTSGDQVPIDGKVVNGSADFDESMLTGESRSVSKSDGDRVYSGTNITSGEVQVIVEKTSLNSKAAQLTKQAKIFKLASSDLRDAINKILKIISFGIIPVAILLIWTQLNLGVTWQSAVLQAASGIVGMIPEGLVLLTSVNFALSAIILAKKQVLVSELNSVETLAKVNVLLLDKTGTITDGEIEVFDIISSDNGNPSSNFDELIALCELPGGGKTATAIKNYIEKTSPNNRAATISDSTPFSSQWKYSSVISGGREYRLGASEIIAPDVDIKKYTDDGNRVLALTIDGKHTLTILCRERIRENAKAIISAFQKSGVEVRVISGDNQETVENIAKLVGIEPQFVVGRALPETKLELVRKLQKEGKCVAMTGDGVNDMLALKEADLGIAMGNAAPASKAVANLVLLNGDFATLPAVLSQGRRVIANIERVASLFLVKTFYSICLTFFTIALSANYPFYPRHLTLISALTIGIPAFFLALPPNNTPYNTGFLKRVLKFSLPFGITAAVFVEIATLFFGSTHSSIQVVALFIIAFIVLAIKARPLLSWRGLMVCLLGLIAIFAFIFTPLSSFFML